MKNVTTVIHMTNNLFRRYLLGDSLKNIFIRFIFILSATIIVWCCMMLTVVLYMKFQRRKLQNSLNSHHLSYHSMRSLTNLPFDDLKCGCGYNSSSTSEMYSEKRQKSALWTTIAENSIQQNFLEENNPNNVQADTDPMIRQPLLSNDKSLINTDDELQTHQPVKQKRRISDIFNNIQLVKISINQ